MNERDKNILRVLRGDQTDHIPFWFMRQAGRYLPEYRELRKKAGSFLTMAYDPEMSSEITMQPIRRFGMDAAIIFSDILVLPHAMGQDLRFEEGRGPVLEPVRNRDDLEKLNLETIDQTLENVYAAISETRSKLSSEGFSDTALIGFAGAPWTVACYMVEGGGSKDFQNVKSWAYRDPEGFGKLIDLLVEGTVHYLGKKIDFGAEVIQLFDSWSGVLDSTLFEKWIIDPTRRIIQKVKTQYPEIPVIGFPRGAGQMYERYMRNTGIDAIAIDSQVPPCWASSTLQPHSIVQGNLDPVCLLTGGDPMKKAAENILSTLASGPFVFNLGHGVIKETPPDHVAELSEMIKAFKK